MQLTQNTLQTLAQDRPLVTNELIEPNDYYGHATLIKKYAGYANDYQTKTAIEHGVYYHQGGFDVEYRAPLPAIMCPSPQRYDALREVTNKALFAIGPLINYSPSHLTGEARSDEERRLQKNLLVFPAHSTHWIHTKFDIQTLCRTLENLGKEFDTIRICLGWKDVLRGAATEYLQHGFECVTAGHMFDPEFLPRLRGLIETATVTCSNQIGTHIGYCIALGKPHFLIDMKIDLTADTAEFREEIERGLAELHKVPPELYTAFSEVRDDISTSQQEVIARYWGLPERRTPTELRTLLQVAEDMYQRGPEFFMSDNDFQAEQALEYLSTNRAALALSLLTQYRPHAAGQGHRNVLRVCDIPVASYPRSGNTWMRFLLADLIQQLHGIETSTILPIDQERIVPNLHDEKIPGVDARIRLPYRLVKTHELFNPTPAKTIYLFRQAEDSLCSHYYFHLRYDGLKEAAAAGIDAFCLQHLADWCAHLNSYIAAKNTEGAEVLFLSYEAMSADAALALQSVCAFLNLPATDRQIARAVENHSFQKHRRAEEDKGNVGKIYANHFFRTGCVGSGEQELSRETLQQIRSEADRVYREAVQLQPDFGQVPALSVS